MYEIVERLRGGDFFDRAHEEVFEAIVELSRTEIGRASCRERVFQPV
jgi:replicative DNA helicase